MTSPSAMPTRSAPSSLAFALISAAVTRARKTATISGSFAGVRGRRALLLAPFEILQLTRDDPLVAVRPNPADIPIVEAVDRLPALARFLTRFGKRYLFGGLFRNDLLR